MCDQLRWDALGCTGSGYVHTPNIDALARRGVVLRNAYCASPVCSPARASWLSGLYPHATGQWINYGPRRAGQPGCRMREDVVTIADVLAAEGYRCANAGVWHLGDDEHPQHGFEAGWITYRYHRDPDDPLVRYFADCGVANPYRRGAPEVQRYGPNTLPFGTIADPRQQRTTWTVDRAVELLDDLAGSPFFLLCGVKDPHPEMMVMPELLARYPEAEVPLPVSRHDPLAGKPRYQHHAKFRIPPGTLDDRSYRRMFAHYYALITHIDAEMGRLLGHLQQLGLADDTVVVFSSDHGEMLGDHGMMGKRAFYEESARVPFLLSVPWLTRTQRRVDGVLGHVDLVSTLLDLAGVTRPDTLQGRSLAGALTGDLDLRQHSAFMEWNGVGDRDLGNPVTNRMATVPWRSIVTGDRWKLNLCAGDQSELFDLNADPWEQTNRFDDPAHRDRIRELAARIRLWQVETGDDAPLPAV
jgi:arylsulfatase